MRESVSCEFEEACKERYTEPEMDEYRKNCDCINCALCEKYWKFYDKQYFMKREKRRERR